MCVLLLLLEEASPSSVEPEGVGDEHVEVHGHHAEHEALDVEAMREFPPERRHRRLSISEHARIRTPSVLALGSERHASISRRVRTPTPDAAHTSFCVAPIESRHWRSTSPGAAMLSTFPMNSGHERQKITSMASCNDDTHDLSVISSVRSEERR